MDRRFDNRSINNSQIQRSNKRTKLAEDFQSFPFGLTQMLERVLVQQKKPRMHFQLHRKSVIDLELPPKIYYGVV